MIDTVKARVTQALNTMSEAELTQVEEFVTFLRFRARLIRTEVRDMVDLAALYAADADEDRALADEGLGAYLEHLQREDAV